MKLLVFDNYDSFTYNIVQLLREAGADDITVVRNDRIALEAVGRFDKIILSPGPGIPSEAGILLPLIREYAPSKSIFGVCLGEQAIGETFGASLKNLTDVYHGIASRIRITAPDPLFAGVPTELNAGRYHSWIVSRDGLPDELQITAEDEAGQIMALAHRRYDVRGVQFHPESVLTPDGRKMIEKLVKNINSTRQTFCQSNRVRSALKIQPARHRKHCGCTKHTQPARHHHQKGIRSIPLTKRIAQTTRNNNDKQAL